MPTISKMFTILCLLCLCWGIGNIIPWVAFKTISKLFFHMNDSVHSVPGQTEGRRKALLEWTRRDLSSKLSLTCKGNFNYYKSVHHPIPTLPHGIGTSRQFSKQISMPSF